MQNDPALEERLDRLGGRSNGGAPPPDAGELDWLLFRSFPGGEVGGERLAGLFPSFRAALDAGVAFDLELLFVRALELGDLLDAPARADLARAAADRALAGALDPADAVAAVRFALRALPDAAALAGRLAADADAARLRFLVTLDFVLDEGDLDGWLSLSYLREDDPDSGPVLARFPVPAEAREALAAMLEPEASRTTLTDGWSRFTDPEERSLLREALAERLDGFDPAAAGT